VPPAAAAAGNIRTMLLAGVQCFFLKLIGELLRHFTPGECAGYFRNAGYGSI
jgi:hypothetical protein